MSMVAHSTASRPAVLIVEDEPEICALLTDIMEAEGFETVCVQSDREAYEALERNAAYACMIIDVNLGAGTTGYDVARFARQIDRALPVVFVSGQTSRQSLEKNGVTGSVFVAKPFTAAQLLDQVHKLVGDNDDD